MSQPFQLTWLRSLSNPALTPKPSALKTPRCYVQIIFGLTEFNISHTYSPSSYGTPTYLQYLSGQIHLYPLGWQSSSPLVFTPSYLVTLSGTKSTRESLTIETQPPSNPNARLVLSPSVYSPSVFSLGFFTAKTFPADILKAFEIYVSVAFIKKQKPSQLNICAKRGVDTVKLRTLLRTLNRPHDCCDGLLDRASALHAVDTWL